MDNKYNQLSIDQYSKALAKQLADQYFTDNQTINGPQLITFTPVRQVNLFIIRELLLKWNTEMANLRSPYFDFENEEVKAALVQFMNTLSRKILIRRPHFEPLLQKAIHDTFLLVLNPAAVFEEKFLRTQEDLSPAKLQDNLKYIDIDKELYRNFLETLSTGNVNRDYVLSKFRLYLDTHGKLRMKPDELVSRFNELMPLQMEDILEKPAAASKPAAVTPASAPAPAPATTPAPATQPAPAPVAEKPAPAAQPAPVAASPAPAPKPAPAPAAPQAAPRPAATQEPKLYEKFRTEKETLNDMLKKPAGSTLIDSHSNKKIESLKNSISINQRFSFINELFDGDNMEYHGVIKSLDEFPDAASAKEFLMKEVAPKHNWTRKEEHVNKLLRLIERKFS